MYIVDVYVVTKCQIGDAQENNQILLTIIPVVFHCSECLNCQTGKWECWILLDVGKGANKIIKKVSSLDDSEIVACQFMFFIVFCVIV